MRYSSAALPLLLAAVPGPTVVEALTASPTSPRWRRRVTAAAAAAAVGSPSSPSAAEAPSDFDAAKPAPAVAAERSRAAAAAASGEALQRALLAERLRTEGGRAEYASDGRADAAAADRAAAGGGASGVGEGFQRALLAARLELERNGRREDGAGSGAGAEANGAASEPTEADDDAAASPVAAVLTDFEAEHDAALLRAHAVVAEAEAEVGGASWPVKTALSNLEVEHEEALLRARAILAVEAGTTATAAGTSDDDSLDATAQPPRVGPVAAIISDFSAEHNEARRRARAFLAAEVDSSVAKPARSERAQPQPQEPPAITPVESALSDFAAEHDAARRRARSVLVEGSAAAAAREAARAAEEEADDAARVMEERALEMRALAGRVSSRAPLFAAADDEDEDEDVWPPVWGKASAPAQSLEELRAREERYLLRYAGANAIRAALGGGAAALLVLASIAEGAAEGEVRDVLTCAARTLGAAGSCAAKSAKAESPLRRVARSCGVAVESVAVVAGSLLRGALASRSARAAVDAAVETTRSLGAALGAVVALGLKRREEAEAEARTNETVAPAHEVAVPPPDVVTTDKNGVNGVDVPKTQWVKKEVATAEGKKTLKLDMARIGEERKWTVKTNQARMEKAVVEKEQLEKEYEKALKKVRSRVGIDAQRTVTKSDINEQRTSSVKDI